MTRGAGVEDFAAKLRLALACANLSGVALARETGVDKSVAARWLAGALRPTEHNLAAASAGLARHIPGFSRADWDLPLAAFADRLGVTPAGAAAPDIPALLSALLRGADQRQAAEAYTGLWALLAASPGGRDRVYGHALRIQPIPGVAALRTEVGNGGTFHTIGALIAFGPKLYRLSQERRRHDAIVLTVLNGVTNGRAAILEGIAVTRDGGVEAAPAAIPVLWLRLADHVDDASFDAACRHAGAQDREGWEALLPAPLLARFRLPIAEPPAPTILRRPLADCWTIQEEYLAEPAMADRRAALEAVRRIYAPVLGEVQPASAVVR